MRKIKVMTTEEFDSLQNNKDILSFYRNSTDLPFMDQVSTYLIEHFNTEIIEVEREYLTGSKPRKLFLLVNSTFEHVFTQQRTLVEIDDDATENFGFKE